MQDKTQADLISILTIMEKTLVYIKMEEKVQIENTKKIVVMAMILLIGTAMLVTI